MRLLGLVTWPVGAAREAYELALAAWRIATTPEAELGCLSNDEIDSMEGTHGRD